MDKISIADYTRGDRIELIRLLLALHRDYFADNAAPKFQELRREKDVVRSYEKYVDQIAEEKDNWKVLLAKNRTDKLVGMIIGSIFEDEGLVLGKMGQFEDWYVVPDARGNGIGMRLYQELEKWFKEKGCQQVCSDTWEGNELSIKAHKKMGFFVSGVKFSKKL